MLLLQHSNEIVSGYCDGKTLTDKRMKKTRKKLKKTDCKVNAIPYATFE